MKKLIVLIVALGILGTLGWFALDLIQNKDKSDKELIDFAIEDIESVDKVIITDAFNQTFEIRKTNGEWTDKDGGCVVPESVEFVLDAIKKIEFKGYLPDGSIERFVNMMASQHTKVEIYQNGEWSKTWYIGPAAQDHMGQIMLLDDSEAGKSDIPVLMRIKGVHGIIDPRFFADPKKWMCTNIFSLQLSDIAKVDLKFNDEPERSFTVTKDKNKLNVYQQGKKLPIVDTSMIFRYLDKYKKINFDIPNYELSDKQVDSVKHTKPFCELTVTETNGKSKKLKCFRIIAHQPEAVGHLNLLDVNRDKFWCELPNGELVKCQYFVFNPLFFGHLYFPLDLSNVKTHDGVLPIE